MLGEHWEQRAELRIISSHCFTLNKHLVSSYTWDGWSVIRTGVSYGRQIDNVAVQDLLVPVSHAEKLDLLKGYFPVFNNYNLLQLKIRST